MINARFCMFWGPLPREDNMCCIAKLGKGFVPANKTQQSVNARSCEVYSTCANDNNTYCIDYAFSATTSWTSSLFPLVPAAAIPSACCRGKQKLLHGPCHIPSPVISANCRREHKGWVNEQTLAGGAARILTNRRSPNPGNELD